MQTAPGTYLGHTAPQDEAAPPDDGEPKRIPAYAKLEFSEGFDFYIQTLSVTIGRRPPRTTPLEPEDLAPDPLSISPVLRPVISAERATSPPSEPPLTSNPKYSATPSPFLRPTRPTQQIHVDVDLGPIKAVSRDHARLYFDYPRSAWALEVKGRNGVVVDGRWRARGEQIVLNHR
jgi:hypothetical protein